MSLFFPLASVDHVQRSNSYLIQYFYIVLLVKDYGKSIFSLVLVPPATTLCLNSKAV